MKIAHVTATFPPYAGGTGNVCYYNALLLARMGHAVTVFTANRGEPGDYPAPLDVRRLRAVVRVGNAPLMPGLLAQLRRYDLIHVHYPFIFGQEMIYLLSLLRHLPYVVTYHQDLILQGMKGRAVLLHERLLGQRILRRARRVMFTSLDYARASRVSHLLEQAPDRIAELPNGVDPDRFRPGQDVSALAGQYGIKETDEVVLFVGGLDTPHYFKGVDVLLRAVALLDNPDVKLLVVGDGDLRPAYERQAAALNLQAQVRFCGRVSDEMLPLHYALCDIHVLPSTTMGEAFGVVLLEAMASARPVIASALPGVRSVVDDGQNGYLARPGDAGELAAKLRLLLDDPDGRRAMGQCGRMKAETRYAWGQIARQLETIYMEVLTDDRP